MLGLGREIQGCRQVEQQADGDSAGLVASGTPARGWGRCRRGRGDRTGLGGEGRTPRTGWVGRVSAAKWSNRRSCGATAT